MHNRVFVPPRDGRESEALVRYMMRPAVSLARLLFTPGSHGVVYLPKAGHDDIEPTERIDAMEFVARVPVQIPDPRRHLVRYYGAYSNACRAKRKKAAAPAEPSSPHEAPEDAAIPDGPYRAALRHRWAESIRRVYEVDPLICPRCGSVIGFVTQPALIDRILDHLRRRDKIPRPPPPSSQPLATPARDPPRAPQSDHEEWPTCRPSSVPKPSRGLGRSPSGPALELAFPAADEPVPESSARPPTYPPRASSRGAPKAHRKGSSYPFTRQVAHRPASASRPTAA